MAVIIIAFQDVHVDLILYPCCAKCHMTKGYLHSIAWELLDGLCDMHAWPFVFSLVNSSCPGAGLELKCIKVVVFSSACGTTRLPWRGYSDSPLRLRVISSNYMWLTSDVLNKNLIIKFVLLLVSREPLAAHSPLWNPFNHKVYLYKVQTQIYMYTNIL